MLALRTFLVAMLAVLLSSQVVAARMQLSGDGWTSPTYGFSVSWAGTDWQVDANAMLTAAGPEKLDRLHLINGVSSLYIEGATRYQGSLAACVEAEAALLAQEGGVSNIRTYEEDGVPLIADGPGRSASAFLLTLESGERDLELVDYIECRQLVPGESVLIITLVSEPHIFQREMALAQPVIDSISVPDEFVNPLEAYGELLAAAQGEPSLTGPRSGELAFGAGELGVERLGVDATDIYVRTTFAHPEPDDIAMWDVGVGFRDAGGDDQFRVVVDADGRWFFKYGLDDVIAQGQVEDFATGPTDLNTIEIVTQGETGYFAFNERLVGPLDLSASAASGDVFVGSGFFAEDATVDGLLPFSDVEVWAVPAAGLATPLPEPPFTSPLLDGAGFATITDLAMTSLPVAGPANGALTQQLGAASVAGAGVELTNFVAEVTFANPDSAGTAPWDFGIAFREQPNGDHYRLTIASDGAWQFQIGTQPPISGGVLPVVNYAPGAENTVTLLVDDANAAFEVNGFFVATLDASALSGAADVWVGTGFRRENVRPGTVTEYRDFEVWELPSAVGGMEAPDLPEIVAVPERVSLRLFEVDDSGVDGLGAIVSGHDGVTLTVVTRDAVGNEVAGLFAGSCLSLAEVPTQVLPPLDVRGQTTANLDQALSDLTRTRHAVALIGAQDTVVACGEIAPGT